ncbi:MULTISPECIES: hypothetical protein [Paraburkholderia]|uniref:hypothetical protein n=1 Tax=Paraburkholderia TaxID=1822464 RepID=UPI00225881BB|nr:MULTISPECIES: hypothetical protein [Paraburkholderia]MCX4162775.1 hypothetical protein [Paraburkholderia megapolitana]MDN7158270.1 hypothetical protein [Paraburkholderia sp. CHISQ3]MDQ6495317.1 hypothetical protein [Paraburkholderia megapolitana]
MAKNPMIQVLPMLDELAAGHQGRIGWINGSRNQDDISNLIRSAVIARGFDPGSMSRLGQLALISDMAHREYVQKHSMGASIDVVSYDGDHSFYDTGLPSSARPGMPPDRKDVCCCIQCIENDLREFNFSWYRRRHHLAGVDWCLIHGARLWVVDADAPFVYAPHVWLGKSRLTPLWVVIERLPDRGFLRRFAETSWLLLQREHRFSWSSMHGTLAQQAVNLGLRLIYHGNRPLISDCLSMQADHEWLKEHLPEWTQKKPFSFFSPVDINITAKRLADTGITYAMRMAVLYQTAGAAMWDVSVAEADHRYSGLDTEEQRRGGNSDLRIRYWNDVCARQFPQADAQVTILARRTGFHFDAVDQALKRFGLPNQQEREVSDTWAVLIRFCFGERLGAACAREHVNREDVKRLLRNCPGRVLQTIRIVRREHRERTDPAGK